MGPFLSTKRRSSLSDYVERLKAERSRILQGLAALHAGEEFSDEDSSDELSSESYVPPLSPTSSESLPIEVALQVLLAHIRSYSSASHAHAPEMHSRGSWGPLALDMVMNYGGFEEQLALVETLIQSQEGSHYDLTWPALECLKFPNRRYWALACVFFSAGADPRGGGILHALARHNCTRLLLTLITEWEGKERDVDHEENGLVLGQVARIRMQDLMKQDNDFSTDTEHSPNTKGFTVLDWLEPEDRIEMTRAILLRTKKMLDGLPKAEVLNQEMPPPAASEVQEHEPEEAEEEGEEIDEPEEEESPTKIEIERERITIPDLQTLMRSWEEHLGIHDPDHLDDQGIDIIEQEQPTLEELYACPIVSTVIFPLEEIRCVLSTWLLRFRRIKIPVSRMKIEGFTISFPVTREMKERLRSTTLPETPEERTGNRNEESRCRAVASIRGVVFTFEEAPLEIVVDPRKLTFGSLIVSGEGGVVVRKGKYCDEDVALKIFGMKPQFALRFEKEVKIMFELKHKFILQAFGCCSREGQFVVVLELGDYRVDRYLKDASDDVKLTSLRQLAEGVAYLHDQGIIHLDLKPANVLIKNKIVKVCDFGVSKHQASIATVDMRVGTKVYMSKGYEAERNAPWKRDVYSFGLMIYELWGNCRPFKRLTYASLEDFKTLVHPDPDGARGERPSFNETDIDGEPVYPEISPVLQKLAQACWHANADRRPPFRWICDVLDLLIEGEGEEGAFGRICDDLDQLINGEEVEVEEEGE